MATIRNLTASPIELNDMGGVTIPANGDLDLNTTPQEEIDTSIDLANAVAAGDIVYLLANGTPLSPADSQTILDQSDSPTGANTKLPKFAGFEIRSQTTLTFSKATGTATLSPVGADFSIWTNGSKYTFTAPLTHVFPLDATARILYFDDNGVFGSTPTPTDEHIIWQTNCMIGEAVFNVGAQTYRGMFDLRFKVDVPPAVRQNMLMTHGAVYGTGLQPGDIVTGGDGTLDTHAQLSISDGVISLSDVPKRTIDFSQQLTLPANIQVAYVQGSERKVKPPGDFPFIYAGTVGGDYTGTRVAYNPVDEFGQGALVEVQDGWYTIIHIMMAMGTVNPITAFVGGEEYATLKSAHLDVAFSIQNLLKNRIQRRYFVPVCSIIIQSKTSFTNIPKAIFQPMGGGEDYHEHRGLKDSLITTPVSFAFKDRQFNIFGDTERRLLFDLSTPMPHAEDPVVTWRVGSENMDFNLVPNYNLIAIAAEPLTEFDEVQMNANGEIATNPGQASEDSTNFTTRSVIHNTTEYVSQNTGIVAYSDATTNTIFFKAGQAGPGSVTWGTEISATLSGDVVEIRATQIDNTRCGICVVDANQECTVFTISFIGIEAAIDDSYTLPDSNIVSADIEYNGYPHLMVGYIDGTTTKNEYLSVDANGLMASPIAPTVMDVPSGGTKIETTAGDDNIIASVLIGSNIHIGESKWRKPFFGTGLYDTNATPLQINATVIGLRGVIAGSSLIFAQAETTAGNFQTYTMNYVSGNSISVETLFGLSLSGRIAALMETKTGALYSAVLNASNFVEIYEGDVVNTQNGFVKILTGAIAVTASSTYHAMAATFFGSTFTTIYDGDTPVNADVYFITPGVNNFLGVAGATVLQGEDVPVLIGLPIVNHRKEYTAGTNVTYGQYTYQAIGTHQLVRQEQAAVFAQSQSVGISTTTSSIFQPKLEVTTDLILPGKYRIEISYGWGIDNIVDKFEAVILEDGVQISGTHIAHSLSPTNIDYTIRRIYSTYTAKATHTYELQYRSTGSGIAKILEASIEIVRVS